MTTLKLPPYPSSHALKALSPSKRASINQAIASSLAATLDLPPKKRDEPSSRAFLASYANNVAFNTLQDIIWGDPTQAQSKLLSEHELLIRKRSLLLAEKIAPSGLDLPILLDLSIVYGRTNPVQLHAVFTASLYLSSSPIADLVSTQLIPAFTSLLSQENPSSQGLYAQRKTAECIYTFLRVAKGPGSGSASPLVLSFAKSKPFVINLATLYSAGLAATAQSYGGLSVLAAGINDNGREPDDWERIWVETKVALLDSFHIILGALLDDLASTHGGPALAAKAESTFDLIFALIDIPQAPAPSNGATVPPIPFLNMSLLGDYQHAYSLSRTLAGSLRRAQKEDDARLDFLDGTLRSLAGEPDQPSDHAEGRKEPGALKILLRSSGIQPGIDNRGKRPATATSPPTAVKGKARAAETPSQADLDMEITQVLDIFPDVSPAYVRYLLLHNRYDGNPEKVVEALLDGTAPPEDELTIQDQAEDSHRAAEEYRVSERRNIFDDHEMEVTQLRVGKKVRGEEVLRDRTFIEQMKADILRRAEAISDEEEDEEDQDEPSQRTKWEGKKGLSPPTDEEDDVDLANVKITADGEASGDEKEDEEIDGGTPQNPETILELAYLRDPKLFDRDATTRRSKARSDLKTQTGWDDEQIEGWKIMLERNPRKDKILQKHEFSGNRSQAAVTIQSGAGPSSNGGRGRGGGRRGGGGGGDGRGGGRGGGPTGGSARERAWKDKNKSSRGNHNRKRGHDKKMARAGAGVPP